MKRIGLLLSLAAITLVTACSFNELPDNLSPLPIAEERLLPSVETRTETYKGEVLDQEYFVTAEDLENFVRFRRSASKRSNFAVREVKSYGFDSSQTLFYILNYDLGWEVVAADKRVQPTLAHGDNGTFSMDSDNEAMKYWMNMLADGVLQTRLNKESESREDNSTASTENQNSSEEFQNSHVDFWESISSYTRQTTRFEPLTPIPGPVDGIKYSYLVDTETQEYTTITEALLLTTWGQGDPWNVYCPRVYPDIEDIYVPAGCTAVAWAQILYYLATELDMTISIPKAAFCAGTYDGLWERLFDLYTDNEWGLLAKHSGEGTSSTNRTAVLIAFVGEHSDMDYDISSSGAFPDVFAEYIRDNYDISCTTDYSYSANTVIRRLRQNEPVLIWGSETEDGGHTWVIDGYEKKYTVTTNYYATFDLQQLPSYIASLDKDDATYSRTTTTITSEKFHMNWGWNGSYNGWFATGTENWTPGTNHDYSNAIEIIYNFDQNL